MKQNIIKAVALACTLMAVVDAKALTGTNIGGWLVLEPWITPSLFYRFAGKNHSEGVGMDSYTLCEALGPVEGNKLMRAHWDAWYTEDDIKNLSARGIEIVRVPIGDWTLDPYGPYIGCMDGAADKVQWILDTCASNNIKVLIDVHTAKGSQNGFDNSGQTNLLIWRNETSFSHWGNAAADWLGYFDWTDKTTAGDYNGGFYRNVNYANVQRSLDMTKNLLLRYGAHSAFYAFEPVNEPWWLSDLAVLKDFYRKVRKQVQRYAPQAKFVFHDAFSYSNETWNDLFEDWDHENVVMDHHYYQAFDGAPDNTTNQTIAARCDRYAAESAIAKTIKYDVWFGEWALATDNCAHWLNGFNDGAAKNQYACKQVECPKPYLSEEQGGVDVDREAALLGPFGYSKDPEVQECIVQNRTIQKGMCWSDSDFYNNTQIEEMARCVLDAYNENLQGQFLWTGHNEIEERWDYVKAWDLGWLNTTALPDESTHYKNIGKQSVYEKKMEETLTFLQ